MQLWKRKYGPIIITDKYTSRRVAYYEGLVKSCFVFWENTDKAKIKNTPGKTEQALTPIYICE